MLKPRVMKCRFVRPGSFVPQAASAWVLRIVPFALLLLFATDRAWAHNILLIVADDLSSREVGAYQERADPPPTPNIDALARDGVLFRNAWGNPLCSPSRALFHTGRYGFRTGVVNSTYFLHQNALHVGETTLPEVMSQAGYDCGLFGKWHLGVYYTQGGYRAPNVAGWHKYVGAIRGGVPDYYEWIRVDNGMARPCYDYATKVNVDDLLQWVRSRNSRPWFCCLAFNAPHTPYQAPPRSLHSQNLEGLNPLVTPVPFFTAMVEAMDREIGRCLTELGDTLNDTTVIFLGDNGTSADALGDTGDPSRAKGTVYEGGIKVPLIIRSPLIQQPGREVSAIVHAVDLFATIAELGGADARTGIDSVSLVPYLVNPQTPPLRSYLYSEVFSDPIPCGVWEVGCQLAIRDDQFKLIAKLGIIRTYEMYDLIADPHENYNLLGAEKRPRAIEARHQKLRQQADSLSGLLSKPPTGGCK
jgi:arylsulfatase B